MKIVQIIDKLVVGGAQKLLVTFAREARSRDVDLTIVVLWDELHQPIVDELVSLGAKVEFFPATRSTDITRFLTLVRYFREQRFNIICTHLFQAGLLGVLLGKISGAPVICTLHNISMPDGWLRSRIWTRVLRWGSDYIIAVGYSVVEAHKKWLTGVDHLVLPNPVGLIEKIPSQRIAELRTSLTGSVDNFLILAVGIVSPQKAYSDLIDAIYTICTTNDHVFLVIAGGGRVHDVAAVTEKITALGLGERVLLLGMRDDIPQLLLAADLFVSSSHWEGLPVAVLEAMAAGLPVVATSVGDIPYVVTENTGVLVPAKNSELLGEAIAELLNDPARREHLGGAAKIHVRQHHSPGVWVDKQLDLFAKLIASQPVGK